MRMFVLMFLFLVESAFATEIPLHQQQIENAAPNQTAIELSAKNCANTKTLKLVKNW